MKLSDIKFDANNYLSMEKILDARKRLDIESDILDKKRDIDYTKLTIPTNI